MNNLNETLDRIIKMNKIRDGATLKIHPETRDRLRGAGKKGETYDTIINRLLDKASS